MPSLRNSAIDLAGSVARAERSTDIERRHGFIHCTFLAMGSPCELLLDTKTEDVARKLADIVAAEAWRIEDKFSRYLAGNIVHQINNAAGQKIAVDDETANLIDFSASLFGMSDGKFDITSGVLRRAWQFDGSSQLPSKATVSAILEYVGWEMARWHRPMLVLPAGMQIDLGGVGKEYAVDKAAGLLMQNSDVAALVNFGGDLFATGSPAGQDGWQVGIDAFDSADEQAKRVIRLQHGALATSGDARRFVLKDGVRYGHILDPSTGWPIAGSPRSITVAADTCTEAGMTATLAMLQGNGAENFLRQQGCRYWVFD
ncbi:MAG: thiamine biosynthesis lipoprotein [Woeseiaceae bacterium]|jgi:thiamine biosynthesis lipoprotein